MKPRQINIPLFSVFLFLILASQVILAQDPLPSWNDGSAKKAIVEFVKSTTEKGSNKFVPFAERIATFDLDGTLWVEQPIPTEAIYCLDRVPALVKEKPELKNAEPFKTVLSGDRVAIAKLSMPDMEKIFMATLNGMTSLQFEAEVKQWIVTAKDARWKKPYTEITYLPMLEVLKYLRANGYKTYIVSGSSQDFMRVFAEQTFGIPPEQVIGTLTVTKYGYDNDGKPVFNKEAKLLINDVNGGKPESINIIIGRRPHASFGNSTGDKEMLEYAKAGEGARLTMLVLHDDANREYAYGPVNGLPVPKGGGSFTQALYDQAQKDRWIVISMKNDWKHIFAFEK